MWLLTYFTNLSACCRATQQSSMSLGNPYSPKTSWTADQDEGISNIYFLLYSDSIHRSHRPLLTTPISKHLTFYQSIQSKVN